MLKTFKLFDQALIDDVKFLFAVFFVNIGRPLGLQNQFQIFQAL